MDYCLLCEVCHALFHGSTAQHASWVLVQYHLCRVCISSASSEYVVLPVFSDVKLLQDEVT